MSHSKEQEACNCHFKKHGYRDQTFFNRPHWTRRQFFQLAGAGVTVSFLSRKYARAADVTTSGAQTKNTAQNVIFILLAGAPSHVDTFDLKDLPGTTPTSFAPTTVNGILWPAGLMPKLGQMTGQFALIRSMQSHALVHSLAQTWTQIGRNPAAALGNIAPNIGSVVAIEKDSQRRPGQVFPTFLALNSPNGVGQGYFPADYAPFRVTPANSGIPYTTNTDGQTRFNSRWNLMHSLDDVLRAAQQLTLWPADERLQRFLSLGAADDVQPRGKPGLRLCHGRQRALRQHLHRERLSGGSSGAESQPGHALYPDHLQ
jgi:hypothetical protein